MKAQVHTLIIVVVVFMLGDIRWELMFCTILDGGAIVRVDGQMVNL